jgi:flagellar biosynthesis protein
MNDSGARPDKRAVALRYDPTRSGAPQVIASGRNDIAERIVETARNSGVHVYEDAALADALQRLPLGEQIPEELYTVVAEILAFVYRVDKLQAR